MPGWRRGQRLLLATLLVTLAVAGSARAEDLSPGWSGTVAGTLHYHDTVQSPDARTDDVKDASTTATATGSSPDGDGVTTFSSHQRTESVVTCSEGSGVAFADWTASGTAPSPKAVTVAFGPNDDYVVTGGGDAMFPYTFHGGGACTAASSDTFSGGPVVFSAPCNGQILPLPADPYTLVGSQSCPEHSDGHDQLVTVTWRLTRRPDRDHDGFPDADDACPDVAGGPSSVDGCPPDKPACADGIDNDGDGRADYPSDPDCVSAEDTDEAADPTLTVDAGAGHVVSDPAGIDCGTTCVHRYPRGQVVSLTPTAPDGRTFDHWEGACSGTGACTLKLEGDALVRAVFSGAPAACAAGTAKLAVRAPVYDARLPLALLPDVDLFTFAPTIRYCWDGVSAKVEAASVLGDVDVGPDTFALELLGFTVDYDAAKEAVSFSRNEARISGDFGLDFDWTALLAGAGAQRIGERYLGAGLKRLIRRLDSADPAFDKTVINTMYQRFGGTSLVLRDAVRAWFRAAERRAGWLSGSPLWRSIEETTRNELDDVVILARDVAMADVSPSELAKKHAAADYVAKLASKSFLDALGDLTSLHFALWQPAYTFSVAPNGTVTDGLDPTAFTNPLLLVSEKPAASAPVPRLAGGSLSLRGTTATGSASCPADGPACTGTAFVTLSVPARAKAAAARRVARLRVPVARGRFRIAAGHRGRIVVHLTRAQARRLRKPTARPQVLLECTRRGGATVVRSLPLRVGAHR